MGCYWITSELNSTTQLKVFSIMEISLYGKSKKNPEKHIRQPAHSPYLQSIREKQTESIKGTQNTDTQKRMNKHSTKILDGNER
jgi:hypothetical protein